jgi:hypothetical protein
LVVQLAQGRTVAALTWGKVDDQFHAHRKAKRAWKGHPRALGLHLLAMSYCAGQLTDGLVDDEFVDEKIPAARERDQVTAALVESGLWARETDGWRINDWHDYNPTRAEVLDRRRKDAERKHARRHGESTKNPKGVRADSNGSPSDPSRAGAFPDPTRPDPTPEDPPCIPPKGGRHKDRVKWEEAALKWARSLGYTADDMTLLRAIRQAEPWTQNGGAAEHFAEFVEVHFGGVA